MLNAALMAVLARRPPVNSVVGSEAFDTWTVLNGSVQADAIAAPNGLTTADRLKGNTNNGNHRVTSATFSYARGFNTASIYAQADQRAIALSILSGANFLTTGFDLTGAGAVQWNNDTPGTRFGNRFAYVTRFGAWYRCELIGELVGGATGSIIVGLHNGSTDSFISATSEGAYIWGAQFEPGPRAGPYIAT